jgi:hypothetical protein
MSLQSQTVEQLEHKLDWIEHRLRHESDTETLKTLYDMYQRVLDELVERDLNHETQRK